MPLKKELFEYIKLEYPDIIKADLKSTAIDLNNAILEAKEQLELQHEKHIAIDEAKKISKAILKDIKILNEDLLRGTFKEVIGKRKVERPLPKIELKTEALAVPAPEKLTSEGRAALKHLRRNLVELKKELGIK